MIISAKQLTKIYNGITVLDRVSISCSEGSIIGVLGANGAGKTTLFRILMNLVTPDEGSVEVLSKSVKPLGGIIEKPALYEYLNAHDNLKLFARIQSLNLPKEQIRASLVAVGLPVERKDAVKNFSMGMKQRLSIAIALLNNPSCLILDEPFSGLDPMGIEELRSLILKLAKENNIGILISSHIIDQLQKSCDYLYVLKEGCVVNQGVTSEIIAQNVKYYTIYAKNIQESKVLQSYHPLYNQNTAKVTLDFKEVPDLIKKLYAEGVVVTSFSPEIDMDRLFEISAQ
ncbi:ABC-2 type transport system ATP-binding protein [Zhouia amylolytica]|uniref:ABC-2 type transport system ATP-binding protein n=1 Tax=Zhouia amylolytica TaxID=376730 RepID=A0A1I6QMI2_9FLAO|nr:ABC transporter ATP-binding protein [Zhouia amylolytica]SFS53610.1 ABC-2 type transport system ATP-binding protein [Zhouia amylolytica]